MLTPQPLLPEIAVSGGVITVAAGASIGDFETMTDAQSVVSDVQYTSCASTATGAHADLRDRVNERGAAGDRNLEHAAIARHADIDVRRVDRDAVGAAQIAREGDWRAAVERHL